jgi:hypothetical protein
MPLINSPHFRPFTAQEVQAITKCPPSVVDLWMKALGPKHGEGDQHDIVGLDFMQTFGIFVGWRFIEEGSGYKRAWIYCKFLAGCSEELVRYESSAGRSWPVPPEMDPEYPRGEFPNGTFVRPPKSRLGNTLNLTVLSRQYGAALDRVFPPPARPG